MLSASPLVIVDCAKTVAEAQLLVSTFEEVLGDGYPEELSVCIPANATELLEVFGERRLYSVILVGERAGEMREGAVVCRDASEGSKEIFSLMRSGRDTVCLGSVDFALEIRNETLKRMNG